ncbi:hypothetical protein Csa_019416, partial [Cucumis sativus]
MLPAPVQLNLQNSLGNFVEHLPSKKNKAVKLRSPVPAPVYDHFITIGQPDIQTGKSLAASEKSTEFCR